MTAYYCYFKRMNKGCNQNNYICSTILECPMKRKSEDTLTVAQELINRKGIFCTQSVHCSYYAVLQRMKYILAHLAKNPIPYDKQNPDDKSSHEKILEEIKNRIDKPKNGRNFSFEFRLLKNDRIKADYTEKQFNVDESADCKNRAESLLYKLKSYFGDI